MSRRDEGVKFREKGVGLLTLCMLGRLERDRRRPEEISAR